MDGGSEFLVNRPIVRVTTQVRPHCTERGSDLTSAWACSIDFLFSPLVKMPTEDYYCLGITKSNDFDIIGRKPGTTHLSASVNAAVYLIFFHYW